MWLSKVVLSNSKFSSLSHQTYSIIFDFVCGYQKFFAKNSIIKYCLCVKIASSHLKNIFFASKQINTSQISFLFSIFLSHLFKIAFNLAKSSAISKGFVI
jgi:hypothetical protein